MNGISAKSKIIIALMIIAPILLLLIIPLFRSDKTEELRAKAHTELSALGIDPSDSKLTEESGCKKEEKFAFGTGETCGVTIKMTIEKREKAAYRNKADKANWERVELSNIKEDHFIKRELNCDLFIGSDSISSSTGELRLTCD